MFIAKSSKEKCEHYNLISFPTKEKGTKSHVHS